MAAEKRAALAAIGIAALVFLAMARKADEPLREYGAGWDNAKVLTADEHFARDGFLKHRLAPYLQVSPLEATPPAYHVYYTHSQPLSFKSNDVSTSIIPSNCGIFSKRPSIQSSWLPPRYVFSQSLGSIFSNGVNKNLSEQ